MFCSINQSVVTCFDGSLLSVRMKTPDSAPSPVYPDRWPDPALALVVCIPDRPAVIVAGLADLYTCLDVGAEAVRSDIPVKKTY